MELLTGELVLPEEQADAARLDGWLLEYCRREKTNIVPRRELQRNVTPGYLRQKNAATKKGLPHVLR